MGDCVFNDRLDQKREDLILRKIQVAVDPDRIIQPFSKPHFLNGKVSFYIVNFFVKRGSGRLRIVEDISHGFAKQLDRGGNFPVSFCECFHSYGFQRIVEKMRIDLIGQKFEFHLMLLVRDHLLSDLCLINLSFVSF